MGWLDAGGVAVFSFPRAMRGDAMWTGGGGGKRTRAAIGFASTEWDFAHFPMVAAQLFDQPLPIPPPARRWDFDLGYQLAQPTALAHGRGRSLASAVLCECTYQGHGLRTGFRLMSVVVPCAFFLCSKRMAFFTARGAQFVQTDAAKRRGRRVRLKSSMDVAGWYISGLSTCTMGAPNMLGIAGTWCYSGHG